MQIQFNSCFMTQTQPMDIDLHVPLPLARVPNSRCVEVASGEYLGEDGVKVDVSS